MEQLTLQSEPAMLIPTVSFLLLHLERRLLQTPPAFSLDSRSTEKLTSVLEPSQSPTETWKDPLQTHTRAGLLAPSEVIDLFGHLGMPRDAPSPNKGFKWK